MTVNDQCDCCKIDVGNIVLLYPPNIIIYFIFLFMALPATDGCFGSRYWVERSR